jgi:hypothetical protein
MEYLSKTDVNEGIARVLSIMTGLGTIVATRRRKVCLRLPNRDARMMPITAEMEPSIYIITSCSYSCARNHREYLKLLRYAAVDRKKRSL